MLRFKWWLVCSSLLFASVADAGYYRLGNPSVLFGTLAEAGSAECATLLPAGSFSFAGFRNASGGDVYFNCSDGTNEAVQRVRKTDTCPAGQVPVAGGGEGGGDCEPEQEENPCDNGREKVVINGVEQCLLPCPDGPRDPVTGACNNQCGDKAGQTFTTSAMAGGWVGCYSGCVANCGISVGGTATFSCTYTGGTCQDDGESPGYQVPPEQQPTGPEVGQGGPCPPGTSPGTVDTGGGPVQGCYGGGGASSGSGGNTGQPSSGAGGNSGSEGGGSWYGGNSGGESEEGENPGFAGGYGPGGGSESPNGQSTMPGHTETEHGTFADVVEEFYQKLYQTPVVKAIDGMKRAFAGGQGTPPTPSFEAFGQTFTIDFHVQLMESGNVRSVLFAVFTLIWVVVGIRIIASA